MTTTHARRHLRTHADHLPLALPQLGHTLVEAPVINGLDLGEGGLPKQPLDGRPALPRVDGRGALGLVGGRLCVCVCGVGRGGSVKSDRLWGRRARRRVCTDTCIYLHGFSQSIDQSIHPPLHPPQSAAAVEQKTHPSMALTGWTRVPRWPRTKSSRKSSCLYVYVCILPYTSPCTRVKGQRKQGGTLDELYGHIHGMHAKINTTRGKPTGPTTPPPSLSCAKHTNNHHIQQPD